MIGECVRRLKSLAVWDTTHRYERVDVGILCVHYSRLSLFLPICFLFEPVVDCTTHTSPGQAREAYAYMLDPLPPIGFLLEHVVVRWIKKVFMAKNKSNLKQTYRATSPKTDVVPFQRLDALGATHSKWSALLGKFWHTKIIVHWNDRSVLKIQTHQNDRSLKWSFFEDPVKKYKMIARFGCFTENLARKICQNACDVFVSKNVNFSNS